MQAVYIKEFKAMDDDLIFVLSVNIIGIFVIDLMGRHIFGLEAAWSVINTMLTMYFYYKHNKGKK